MSGKRIGPRAPLSLRECETLTALAEGSLLKDIARTFAVEVATASTWARRAYAKLGAETRLDAVLIHRRAHRECATRLSRRGGRRP